MDNLFILLLIPVLGALVLAFVQQAKAARQLALLVSLVSLGLTIPFLVQFVPDASMQFEQRFAWIPSLGIHFHIGIDGISLPLVLLTNGLIPLIILSAFNYDYKGGFYALVLFMQAGLLLVFTALDAFAFYVGWEVALIPIYFICALWGGENRIRVNIKFFIYTFFGSLLMLVAIIYLHMQVPTEDYELTSFYQLGLDASTQRWIFWAFFIAFAIKMPIFPFHTWQPDTYTEAPTAGTMLLAAIMLKMGVYGVIRWLIPIAPLGTAAYGQLALVLCVIGVVYASVIAFKQGDIKRLIAYSSIAHVGLIGAGIFAWNVQGLQGAIIQMINHGISVVGLFFVADILIRRLDTRDMAAMGGIAKPAPVLAILFLTIVMGAIGLPITNGFIGEFLLLMGIYQYGIWYAALGGLTIILGAVYLLRMYQKVMLGEVNTQTAVFTDIRGTEWVVLAVVVVLIIGIGVYPKPLLDLSEAAVTDLINKVGLIR
ncbi:NADH:ubiquinone oxidoreductase subunit M [Parapedobacter pyrenivorans]|uniref:NADH:ubiquinone oxidoreductase subunit M n=1 Tax=Parapedobacter pyrenivorans TaxID=1305674 RepID=A0A917M6B2_9SPHI|nr:NADH-quinone oxidoreductase subunit M [Parapedobacter pyrenivorans]GGG80693.1 NADH:ubiquinone oxidoreductase subunit M [Parapedobacter pyrenivorans]